MAKISKSTILRTTSATRRKVVSRSSEVLTTSATSSSSRSKGGTPGDKPAAPLGFAPCTAVPDCVEVDVTIFHDSSRSRGAIRRWKAGKLTRYVQTLPCKRANVRQITVALSVIESITHHKFIRYGEANIIARDWHLPARRLIQQRSNAKRLWLMPQQDLAQPRQGQACVQNILHKNYVLACQRLIHILRHSHLTRRIPTAQQLLIGCGPHSVAGNTNEIKRAVEVDMPRQIAEENRGALEYAHQNNGLPGKVFADLRAHLRYTFRNLLARDKNLKFRHGLRF